MDLMRFWSSMALAKARERGRAGVEDNLESRGDSSEIPDSCCTYTDGPAIGRGTWVRLIDGLVEVVAEAVGGYDEEDVQLFTVVVVHA